MTNTNIKHLKIMGGIDDDLILRSERAWAKRPARLNLKLISVAAAVLALALLAVAAVPGLMTDTPEQPPIVIDTPETSIWENPDIIWGSGGGSDGDISKWNNIYVASNLAWVLNKKPNELIAVSVYIKADPEFSIDGKTIDYYARNVQAATNEVLTLKRLIIYDNTFWENALNDPEKHQTFIRKFGEEIYKRCFEEGSHAFIKEEAEVMLKEAINKLYIAYDEENAFLRKYYDTIMNLSDFTDKLDRLNIQYKFVDRDTSHGEDIHDDFNYVPSHSEESYVPGKDIVILVTAESFAKLNIDNITTNTRVVVFWRFDPNPNDGIIY